ncbi:MULTISPECIES: hypothetical protein [unclassified Herbaspirillum]|uniref:hypothetical protein n=1 Tax=unclassified Herbaspirillum TaxID=2624150 RepID=UPI00115396C1|nr:MULTISPECIES: hypothetical protein [unclassified Herbaspirillum]MBB5393833.1 hypothetical protein [Herbaspirillum sp. SJZ102]
MIATTDASPLESSGYLSLRQLHSTGNDNERADRLSVLGLIKSRMKLERDLLTLQLRPLQAWQINSDVSETNIHVDELFWEHQFSPVSFVFLGKRKIVNGVATGRNPSDFFNQGKTEDRTLADQDRRAEKEGDEMAGWSYFGSSYSLQSLLATPFRNSQRIRAMLQLNSNWNALATDVSLIAYYADRPALGVNLSAVLGEKTIVYAEAAMRKGRDRQSLVLSANGTVTGTMDDSKRWIADIVIGRQYTTDRGITLTTEYWRNDNGFSNQEYAGITHTLTSDTGNPRLAGSLLSTPGLRRNSVFIRIGDIPLLEAQKGEITWIRNLDDASNYIRCAISWDINQIDSLRLGFDKLSGARLSEYGASKINNRFFLIYKRNY